MMVKLPEEPWSNYSIFGHSFSMSYPLSGIILLSFTFGYLDTISYIRFGCFTCIQTGNIALFASDMFVPAISQLRKVGPLSVLPANERVIFLLVQALVSTFGGVWLMKSIEILVMNRKKTLVILLILMCWTTVITDVLLNMHRVQGDVIGYNVHWLSMPIAMNLGALSFWSSQVGRVLYSQTMNLYKIGLALGKFGSCHDQGCAKERGDTLALCFTVPSYILGAFISANVMSSNLHYLCFSLFTLSFPMQIWIGGCWKELAELVQCILCRYTKYKAPRIQAHAPPVNDQSPLLGGATVDLYATDVL